MSRMELFKEPVPLIGEGALLKCVQHTTRNLKHKLPFHLAVAQEIISAVFLL